MTTVVVALIVAVSPANRPNEEKDFHSPALIQQHLRGVVTSLRDADVRELSQELRARRAFLIERLEAYTARGVFPHNHVLPYQNPIFLDEHDTACAVGQLIIDSGHRDLAERIRAKDNTGYLLELDVDGLAEWVATSGFTPNELATIQPSYGPARSDDTWLVRTDLQGESARVIKIARRPWWGASNVEVNSAVEFGGTIYFSDRAGNPTAIQRVGEAGPVVERETQNLALAVADGTLFSLENDQIAVRSETGPWGRLVTLSQGSRMQVRSTTDLWVLAETSTEATFSHFDGVKLQTEVTVPRGNGVADFFVATDERVFFVSDNLYVTSKNQPSPTKVLEGSTSVFGAGDQVYGIRGAAVFKVNANNDAEQVFDGLPAQTGFSSKGAVLRDGRVAIVGPEGSLTLRSASGEWTKKSFGTRARFADVTAGPTGLVISVNGAPCKQKDWLCDSQPSQSGCSTVDGSSMLALLFALGSMRRWRSAR